ncbi:MAG TPA: DUF2339 domain-containing protein [Candidatus Angelobacter sp.]
MNPKVKPGWASLIVFTVVTVLVFWGAAELDSREFYAFLAAVFLLFVWWSFWRWRRKLFRRIEEVSGEAAAGRHELEVRAARLEAELSAFRGAPPQMPPAAVVAPAPAVMAAAAAAARATATVSAVGAVQGFSAPEPGLSSPPPPPPPPPGLAFEQAAANLTFGQGEAIRPSGPSLFQRLRALLKFEELLGSNLFAKIGALILVLGAAFGLNWAWGNVGAVGKVGMGLLVGAGLLGAGMFFERNERYRIIARSSVAAGWAIIFFIAFAMNHVKAAQVITSEVADLGLMFVVAAAMVLHTLRYRSQVATGLAFLSAFAGIFATTFPSREVPPVGVSSLTAAVVLAVGVAWVAVRRQWFVLEVCAIAATFLNHFVWLIHIIQPMGKHHVHFDAFLPSAAILASYWAVYRASYLIRRGDGHERVSALAALLNTALLLAVLKYQSVHPEYAFWALLALGAVELGLGQLPHARRRSMPHIVLTVIGACLLFTAIPFRVGLEAKGVALLWLAMAEAFFLVGVLTKEQVFRRVGLFAFVPLAGQLISMEAARVFGARMDGSDFKGEFMPAAVCALAALVLYVNVHWAPRRWPAQFESIVERIATRDLSYFAAVLALVAGWMAFPALGTAVSWMGLACALSWLAYRFEIRSLRMQSMLLAAFAFIRVLAINLPDAGVYHLGRHPWSARLVTTTAVVVLCYLAAYWHGRAEALGLRWLEPSFTWVASTMFTLLIARELSSASVALGWGAFALIVLEAGIWRGNINLRLQAYVAGVCTFLRLLLVNLNAPSVGWLSPRAYTIVPLAALFFYCYQRLDEQRDHLSTVERKVRAAAVFAWLGTTTVVLMLRFAAQLDWVAAAWAATVFAVIAVAWWTGRRVFMHQALLLSLGVLFRGILHNLYERSYFTPRPWQWLPWLNWNMITVISAAGLLFVALIFAFKLRLQPPDEKRNWLVRAARLLDAHPEQVLFFVPLALFTAFLGVEVASGWLTLAWVLEAVAVLLAALWIGERSYRLSAMGLLLLCAGKIFILDFRHMSRPNKAITFTTVGVLFIGVSILYTKYREKMRQFL